jgi:hypothetical protein
MQYDVKALLNKIIETSDFLFSISSYRKIKSGSRVFSDAVRSLDTSEVDVLKRHGNVCSDWSLISVHEEFRPDTVFNSSFSGHCVIGAFDKTEKKKGFHACHGIYNSSITNSEIGCNCLVWNSVLSEYLINNNVVVSCVGSLVCTGKTSFGNNRLILTGVETGGRELISFAEIPFFVAEQICKKRQDESLLKTYRDFCEKYAELCMIDKGIIEEGVRIINTPSVKDSYFGNKSLIDSAQLVDNCTVMSDRTAQTEITSGSIVQNSCVQRGCSVSSMAIVNESVLLEHSGVERHGKVTNSLIGHNSIIAEGEVTSAFVGPFVGFHHQALLIAAMWPEGKGNVGYGANVGSNHSGRAPDQEIWCGEGTFFGLGVNIKFPSNFSRAPYTIFATGLVTLPQAIEFPFSLISTQSESRAGISPAYNEIFPGWTLYSNLYMIKRNEKKFRERDKTGKFDERSGILRPDIVDIMIIARNRLVNITDTREFYTDKDICGTGKNILTEKGRVKGVDAYNFFIEYYCLTNMYSYLVRSSVGLSEDIYTKETSDACWEHGRKIIISERFSGRSIIDNLNRLCVFEKKVAADVLSSRKKDEIRGTRIIPDYLKTHLPAEKDSFVKETFRTAEQRVADIEAIIRKKERYGRN